jgi:hypothetical protein
MAIDTETRTLPKQSTGQGKARLRHYVELDHEGKPTDQCLCGYLWDQLHVQHNGEICQACVDEMRRRGQS